MFHIGTKVHRNIVHNCFSEVTSSSKITENPVGFLQEYCVAQRMSVPSYTQEPTQLGYSVICTVNNFSCTGKNNYVQDVYKRQQFTLFLASLMFIFLNLHAF